VNKFICSYFIRYYIIRKYTHKHRSVFGSLKKLVIQRIRQIWVTCPVLFMIGCKTKGHVWTRPLSDPNFGHYSPPLLPSLPPSYTPSSSHLSPSYNIIIHPPSPHQLQYTDDTLLRTIHTYIERPASPKTFVHLGLFVFSSLRVPRYPVPEKLLDCVYHHCSYYIVSCMDEPVYAYIYNSRGYTIFAGFTTCVYDSTERYCAYGHR